MSPELTESELIKRFRNIGISPVLKFLYIDGDRGGHDFQPTCNYILILSDKHIYRVDAGKFSVREVMATLNENQRPEERAPRTKDVMSIRKAERYAEAKVKEYEEHARKWPNDHWRSDIEKVKDKLSQTKDTINRRVKKENDAINVLYSYWLDYKDGKELEDNIKEIGSDLKIYESRVQSKSIAGVDAREVSELYKTIQNMRKTAIETESEQLSKIEELLSSAQDLRAKIVVHGDYIAGDKTQLKDSSMATDQSITAHDSVVTSSDRRKLQFLEEMRDELSEETYLRLKDKYERLPELKRIK